MPSFSSVDWTDDGLGNPVKMHANKQLLTGWLKSQHGLRGLRDLRLAGDPPAPRRLPRPGRGLGQRRRRHVHGADPGAQQPDRVGRVHPDADRPGRRRRRPMARIDDAVVADPDREVRARPLRAPDDDRTHLADVGSKAHRAVARRGGRRESRCCSATSTARCRSRRAAGLCRRQQRRQHRQPGRRLDADLAGRLDQRHPRDTILDGIEKAAKRRRHLQRGRLRAGPAQARSASWWSARRRTPRASATWVARSGPTTRATTACRGSSRRWSSRDADKQAIRTVCARTAPARCWSSPAGRW